MFHTKNSDCESSGSGIVLTTDSKPRLRWTAELHERFIDAVAQLGGPDKATPKSIMKVMGVKGLTLYHLKSHLQKFRLGKQPHRDLNFNDHSIKDRGVDFHRNPSSSSSVIGRSMNEMQMEVQRRLHEQLEVQRRLQLRIEAQGKYMQSMLDKACQTLGSRNLSVAKGNNNEQILETNDINSFQNMNLYGLYGGSAELIHHNMGVLTSDNDHDNSGINLGKRGE